MLQKENNRQGVSSNTENLQSDLQSADNGAQKDLYNIEYAGKFDGTVLQSEEKSFKTETSVFRKVIGGLLVAGLAGWLFFNIGGVHGKYNEDVVFQRVTKTVKPGEVLMAKDLEMKPDNFRVVLPDEQGMVELQIWDFAKEDGDYIQVLVNDKPVTSELMILHKPVKVMVPAKAIVKIKGVKDGGGGITYAVYQERTGSTFFNSVPEGAVNTYSFGALPIK